MIITSMKYHKILTLFKRNTETNFKTLLEGEYACPEFEYLKDATWAFTEKVDGTNTRVMWDAKQVRFGGRTDNAQIPALLLSRLQDLFPQDRLKAAFPNTQEDEDINVCLYGEGYGAKIQKGGGNYLSSGCDFVLFDIMINGIFLKREAVLDIASKLGTFVAPMVGAGTIDEMVLMVKSGFNSVWGDFQAEGIVARTDVELMSRTGDRLITKLKCKDFLR